MRKFWCLSLAWLCGTMFLIGTNSHAGVDSDIDLPPELMTRYEILIAEIRCPKCLNINIADSNAPIAADLRLTVADLLRDGKSNEEIKAFLRARFGDFVDYNPPLSPATLALWVLPACLLLSAGLVLTFRGKRNVKVELTPEEQSRLEKLKSA